ncbi:hypothetical protein DJ017_02250 [Phenylobacterium soli]|uniref:Lipoprotein n=1 Tax=Phenylobacterium soli TaxID=2170551 RepID=A0A328AFB8_9CAUL|nr:hypothetical protein DJ017_02250 [Phenylobacterium soli]
MSGVVSSGALSGTLLLLSLAGLALAACDEAKPRPPVPAEGQPPPGPRDAAAAAKRAEAEASLSKESLPDTVAWAKPYVGEKLDRLFPKRDGACVGNTDLVTQRYGGEAPGVRVLGWAWDPAARKPLQHMLLSDERGTIVGAGETGAERTDVTAVRKDVTSHLTGWLGYTAKTRGEVDGWALMPDGKTLCPLGHLTL